MKNKHFLTSLSILFFLIVTLALKAQPNFVVVVLDDQGWTGTSLQMHPEITTSKSDFYHTPELVSFAASAMTFSQGYAPSPKCSPSRCSIMTGQSTARNGFTNTDNVISTGKPIIEATSNTVLPAEQMTYAEWLKATDLGYRTAHFGKWHLGSPQSSSPAANGFDTSDGATSNADGNHTGIVQEDPKKIFELSQKTVDFMTSAVADEAPFLVQISHYAVHKDIEARQETIDLYNNPLLRPMGTRHTDPNYAAMTEDTDSGLGVVLQAIENLGIDDNTYIVFISDNGGQLNATNNSPLSYGKTFLSEGGIRVPFIIKGPGISENSYHSEAVVAYDLFPTIAELSGSSLALPEQLDGESLVPLFSGAPFSRKKPLFFHSPHYDQNPNKKPRSVAIQGHYKFSMDYESGVGALFDLSQDIGEDNDISSSQPEIARNLHLALRDHLKEVNANMPTLDPTHSNFSGTGLDVDADGLLDNWEFEYLLSHAYGPNDDTDGDGISNLDEFNNGTDPLVDEATENTDLICDKESIFANESSNAFCMEEKNHVRKIYTNNIPAHDYGPFAGKNDILAQDFEYSMCLYPEFTETAQPISEDTTSQSCGGGVIFGVSDQGVNYSPFARIYFTNPTTQEENLNFHVEAEDLLVMDANGGHVNNLSRYHYHNIPSVYFENDLQINGSKHSPLVGYAADGFPIYYKYLYGDSNDSNSAVQAFESSYKLKSGSRGGDGITAPDGSYDGSYIEDYEYLDSLSELDECGGRYGRTPEYPEGTYYYVLTDNWPFIPRCLKGKYIDNSFKIGLNCPTSTALEDCSTVDLGIEESANTLLDWYVFPNPVKEIINIHFDTSYTNDAYQMFLYNSNGQVVYSSNTLLKQIPVTSIPTGIYYLQIGDVNNQTTRKIQIQ